MTDPTSRSDRVSTTVVVPGDQAMVALLGSRDELLRVIEKSLDSDIHVRGNEITITGHAGDNAIAVRLFEELIELLSAGQNLTPDAVSHALGILTADSGERPAEVLSLNILSRRGKNIRPKTLNQKRYVDAIDHHTIVFGIGPAGTGKTYLAVAKAVQALQAKQVTRIILTRPAVEAGERLGFLPGTLYDKIDPYLRPLLDALHDMVDPDSIPRLTQSGTIEVAPLAYMRGRAQPYESPVLTPWGFRSIGSLRVGDLVTGSDGRPTPVLGIYPQGVKDVYRVRTQDGASTLCCGEHLWTVQTPDDRSHGRACRVIETRDMIGRLRRGQVHMFELPLVGAVE
ncbi:MAG TPA: PhoH family protein, partial [Jatrophihabitantaceae bacterium]|nr:PhoH family protein [Jatrophihabitantaceae bacterium]